MRVGHGIIAILRGSDWDTSVVVRWTLDINWCIIIRMVDVEDEQLGIDHGFIISIIGIGDFFRILFILLDIRKMVFLCS